MQQKCSGEIFDANYFPFCYWPLPIRSLGMEPKNHFSCQLKSLGLPKRGDKHPINPSTSRRIQHWQQFYSYSATYTCTFLAGQPATIKVDVKMPENYPVDLYYLMDLSGSMVEDLKKFPSLGQQIGMNQLYIINPPVVQIQVILYMWCSLLAGRRKQTFCTNSVL